MDTGLQPAGRWIGAVWQGPRQTPQERCIMARRFDFWTHGVTTILESPALARLVVHNGNIGTVVEQEANTSAWFHIPITTPTVLEDDTSIFLRRFGLKAR